MKKHIYLTILTVSLVILSGCAKGFKVIPSEYKEDESPDTNVYFPIASATINVNSYGQMSRFLKQKNPMVSLFLARAIADVPQGSASVNVTYNNPGARSFSINTSSLGTGITTTGTDLNLGSVTISALDDNTLRVCTGVSAPNNKCNRLYIRVFTLGTATGGITGTPGFINTTNGSYGLDVFAGSVLTPLGSNPSATAASVTNAATVYTYVIPNGSNRNRLSNLSIPSIPIKADLSNAGDGSYEMNLVVQYALGYQ